MASSASPQAQAQQQQQQRHPYLAAGPLYAFALPVPLLPTVRTLQSPINEPLPSPHDIIANPSSRPYPQAQPQQQLQQQSTSAPPSAAPTLSIRFPKARSEATSAKSATVAAAAAASSRANGAAQEEDDDSTSDENDDDTPAYAAIGAGPNAPFIWLHSSEESLAQQQFGIHRSLFTLPPSSAPAIDRQNDFPVSHLLGLQLPPITRPRGIARSVLLQSQHKGGVHGLTGRALKAQGVQEAARRLGFRIIEGAGYIAGLGKIDSSVDEEGESSDEEIGGQAGTDGTDEEHVSVPSRHHSDGEADEGDDAATNTATSTVSRPSTSITPLQQSLLSSPELKTWTVILLGGGHFAAAIIALNPFYEVSPKLFPNGPPIAEQLLHMASTQPNTDRSILLLAHKTIHRYTTRRKQGGSQSTQDASGKFAKSAGAQLRRYGEQSLRDEIRATLSSPGWRTLLAQTDRVWVRAGARAASGVLWNWPSGDSPLDIHRAHDTVVSVPVQTRKPTLGECVRIWAELSRVRVRSWSPAELAALEEDVRVEREKGRAAAERRNKAALASADAGQKVAPAEVTRRKAAVLTDRERAGRDRFNRMVDMVRKGKTDTLVDFLSKYEEELVKRGGGWGPAAAEADGQDAAPAGPSIDTPLPLWWRAHEAGIPLDELRSGDALNGDTENEAFETVPTSVPSTLLQLASEAGAEDIVQYLLIERRANPTLPIQPFLRRTAAARSDPTLSTTAPHRTAYDLTTSRPVRDIFRRLMAEQPDWYDWAGMGPGGARIPSALTGEMEERREGKAKERRNLMREKARAREAATAASSKGSQSDAPSSAFAAAAPAPPPAPPKPSSDVSNRLGGGSGGANAPSALRQAIDQQAGVTPEMRARIEREKRARAAEARMKALQGGKP
ncbi:hypothetical protein OC834_001773 [Tilletia horrida]|nr:hypothetical protein OC834_001773 [Tilletia horrida]